MKRTTFYFENGTTYETDSEEIDLKKLQPTIMTISSLDGNIVWINLTKVTSIKTETIKEEIK